MSYLVEIIFDCWKADRIEKAKNLFDKHKDQLPDEDRKKLLQLLYPEVAEFRQLLASLPPEKRKEEIRRLLSDSSDDENR